MSKKMRYYRTAALLGPHEQHVAFRATPQPIKIPWTLVAVFAVVLAMVLWLNLDNAWFLMWNDLTVKGVTSPEVVDEIKEISDLLGYHRFFLRPQRAVEPILAAMPQFEDVQVRCGLFPTKCTVLATPRSPVLVWVANGQHFWVDAAGVFFPPQGERPDLSVITGPAPEEVSVSGFTALYQGIQALASLGIAVDELAYSPRMGLIWTDPQGCRVAFGVGTEMAPRWEAYEAVTRHCAAQGISPRAVDARFPGGASYSLELTW
ncbi:MAG: cell division protein FtsQ/DivIB [Anaerolineae bacterium]|nr:cell division protein FtsQ/DivIB [Anaerolineae bacterium]